MNEKKVSKRSAKLPRQNGRGTAFIRRGFKGVFIRRASGTNDPDTFDRYIRMLEDLADRNEMGLLRQVAAGEVTVAELHDSYRMDPKSVGGEHRTGQAKREIEEWLDRVILAETTLRGYRVSLLGLLAQGHADLTVAELPGLLKAARKKAEAARHGRSWNNTKTALQSFLRENYGRRDQVYLKVLEVEPLPVNRRVKKQKLSPGDFLRVLEKVEPVRRRVVWAMATTGAGPKEFWRDGWTVQEDRVLLHGHKREHRDRTVPLVDSLDEFRRLPHRIRRKLKTGGYQQLEVSWPHLADEKGVWRPVPSYWSVLRHLHAAAKLMSSELGIRTLDLYDCRRHYSHWLQLARVPRARRRLYYGHQSGDVTDLYEDYEVTAYLKRDGRRLRWVLEHNSLAGYKESRQLARTGGNGTGDGTAHRTAHNLESA